MNASESKTLNPPNRKPKPRYVYEKPRKTPNTGSLIFNKKFFAIGERPIRVTVSAGPYCLGGISLLLQRNPKR